jgi:hypothetical protein
MSKKKDSFKPWLSRPTINKSVTLPLTSPLTQRLSNLNEFHPNELDPFLLFDASDSMIGTLENPTLDLDPSKPDTLNVITAVRAGVATYTDESGLIQSATANTVRVDNSLGYPAMLIEPSATNLLPYSEDFSNPAWIQYAAGTGVTPIVTPDFGTSPDGTVSASRIQFNKGSGTGSANMSFIYDSAQTSSGATTSKSVYLKSNTTEAYEMVIYESQYASGSNVKKITVTPDWQRFDIYGAIPAITTGIVIGLRELNVSGLSNTADVLVWGAQAEAGSVATSYIPTSGSAVTRAADDLSITGSAFSDFYNQSEGTIYVETLGRELGFNYVYSISDGTSSNRIFAFHHNVNHVFIRYSGATQADIDAGTFTAGTLCRYAASFKQNDVRASIDGGAAVTDTSATLPTVSKINIGARETNAEQLNGHIKRLIYWPTHSDSL